MQGLLTDFLDLDDLKQVIIQAKIKFKKLKNNPKDYYDERLYQLSFEELFLDSNNSIVDGEFQQLRYDVMKRMFLLLDVPGLVAGFSGFDLVKKYDLHNDMFILVDKWSDLDDELIAIMYLKCQSYLAHNPQDNCTVVELFGEQGIVDDWRDEEGKVDQRLSLISRDRMFNKLMGKDITEDLLEFFSKN